jgi:predicted DNA-binding transcriptional regulator AlpA
LSVQPGAPNKDETVMRIARFEDLVEKGVCGSRASLYRLRRDDPNFPIPVKIGAGIGWLEAEVDAWLAALPRLARREQPSMIEDNRRAAGGKTAA